MSIERVRKYFSKIGIANRILEFDISSATVELAAKALNCEEGKIAKSLSFSVNGSPVIVVMSGDARVNNAKFKAEFQVKPKMLSPEEAELLLGHKVGGVCPFALNEGVDVYLDVSLKEYSTVFPACGSSNSAIELTLKELEEYSFSKKWVDVSKLPE